MILEEEEEEKRYCAVVSDSSDLQLLLCHILQLKVFVKNQSVILVDRDI